MVKKEEEEERRRRRNGKKVQQLRGKRQERQNKMWGYQPHVIRGNRSEGQQLTRGQNRQSQVSGSVTCPTSFLRNPWPRKIKRGREEGSRLRSFACGLHTISSVSYSASFPKRRGSKVDLRFFTSKAYSKMELFSGFLCESSSAENLFSHPDAQRCPFLRNINEPTNFSFSSSLNSPFPTKGAKGPIFEDGPSFDLAFKLFHGHDGVVPLSGKTYMHEYVKQEPVMQFNPLAARAASISLSSFGLGGPFGFDFFSKKWKENKKSSKNGQQSNSGASHEALSNEWLEKGQCPIAKSYRAVSGVIPLVAKVLQPPPGMKFKCPPAVVAARAALARTALVKTLRPQPLPAKMLAIALLGMAANVPLGIWREHTEKFSPQWFAAVHAAVPFIAMLRKSVVMPKTAMALTIAASILGQTIGSRAERFRLKASVGAAEVSTVAVNPATIGLKTSGHCGEGEARVWEPLPLKVAASGSSPAASPTASVCY
ncbi:hypothetical protein Cni_G21987 [Canna indica]|uniref:Uncharacterized protein n=1 Tax=Canna indica TaxID=4628 RepID=A0AAQ3KQK5_9LILI|nr:hypothetical protein Cni_G21987 [Canna indica]